MNGNSIEKDSNAVLDYQWDWSLWLGTGEVITDVVFTVAPGITRGADSSTLTTATLWLSGGIERSKYKIDCKITTNQDRTDERSIYINIRDK